MGKPLKYDGNTEAFQMRAQWKKAENCRKLWFERWSWLLDERKEELARSKKIRHAEAFNALQKVKVDTRNTLKPVPLTSARVIGWLASRPECQLEVYTSWLNKPPLRLPDAWDNPDYTEKPKVHS